MIETPNQDRRQAHHTIPARLRSIKKTPTGGRNQWAFKENFMVNNSITTEKINKKNMAGAAINILMDAREPAWLCPIQENVPDELKAFSQWVLWKAEFRGNKWTKAPYSPTGGSAKVNDSRTWGTFDQVCNIHPCGQYTGIGFVLTKDDPFCGFDLDKCRDPQTGNIEFQAMEYLDTLQSYSEISPSGTGLRILIKGQLPQGGRRKDKTEMYDHGRYLTITGHRLDHYPTTINERSGQAAILHQKLFAVTKPQPLYTDDSLLQRAFEWRNGGQIQALFNGDWGGYSSQSEADQALCNHLSFLYDRDPMRVDAMFRQSGLYRDKWDKKHFSDGQTYGQATIDKAISGTIDTYQDRRAVPLDVAALLANAGQVVLPSGCHRTRVEQVLQWINDPGNDLDKISTGWAQRCMELPDSDVEAVKSAVQMRTAAQISTLNKQFKAAKSEAAAARRVEETKRLGIAEIFYDPTRTGECCQAVSKALAGSDVFRFSGQIVRVTRRKPTSIPNPEAPEQYLITNLGIETLTHEFEKVARCVTTNRNGEPRNIGWPREITQGVMALTDSHERPLAGLVEHPFIGPDCQPVTAPGYDPSTWLYSTFNGQIGDDFQSNKDAFAYLRDELFAEFSFATDMDQAAAIGCLLTAVQRKIIAGGCPWFMVSAPVQSSGKTALIRAISNSVYGRDLSAIPLPESDEEMGKALLAILREGQPAILFDNLRAGSSVESGPLAAAMTSDSYGRRLLSTNSISEVPTRTVWLMTGNGVCPQGDFNTRFLTIELDTRSPNPDQRRFKRKDISAWCLENRERTLSACLKIIMAGSGSDGLTPSRFPSWDAWVRNPLYAASGLDIGELFQRNKASDPLLEGQISFFQAWFEIFGSRPVTCKEILDACRVPTPMAGIAALPGNYLREALEDIFTGGLPSTRSLGNWLSGHKNRFHGGYRLVHAGRGTSGAQREKALWVVENQF